MKKEEFLKKFNLSEDEFSGRKIINCGLDLSHKNIDSLPEGFNPSVVGDLDLSNNNIKSLPKGFNPHISYGSLDLSKNPLTLSKKDIITTNLGYISCINEELSAKIKDTKMSFGEIRWCWRYILEHSLIDLFCEYQDVSEEIINEFHSDFLQENSMFIFSLTAFNKFSESFIRKNIKHFKLNSLLITQDLPEDFLREYAQEITDDGWKYLAEYQKLSFDFIIDFEEKLDLYTVLSKQKVTTDFIEERVDKLKKELILKNSKLKPKTRVFNFNLPDDFREYLQEKADKNRSTISQEIINLILTDIKGKEMVFNKYPRLLKRKYGSEKISFIPQIFNNDTEKYVNIYNLSPSEFKREYENESEAVCAIQKYTISTLDSTIVSEEVIELLM